ncbi:Hypothetical protein FKW44_002537 [Caligus rogercresseyi]|uniref:Uncharacterized protein n=1 Tax=Caligus rogercresseyi TaxID=217165 RepID=A0A7T8KKJ4_CALRO|nr:Hypothetical protein FKW44_002537 [Caligus rogercresseyi]
MWKANWLKMSSCRQTKYFISEPYLGKKMYHYRRASMNRIVSMASGHINLNGHLHQIHVIYDCPRTRIGMDKLVLETRERKKTLEEFL